MTWKSIDGYAKYEISDTGLIKNTKTNKIKKPFKSNGYEKIQLYGDTGTRSFRVHRLVAKMFLEEYRDDLPVDHIDRVRTNNNATNLRVVTTKENLFNRSIGLNLVDDIITWYESGISVSEIKDRLSD